MRHYLAFFAAFAAALLAAPRVVAASLLPGVPGPIDSPLEALFRPESRLVSKNFMLKDASDQPTLPAATLNLGLNFTVRPGDSIQAALTAAAAAGGATVSVQAGTYDITAALSISSNTKLACGSGATINSLGANWTGGADDEALTNINHQGWSGGTVIDHDIVVNGCTFTEDSTFAARGSFKAISFRKARHIWITNNNFNAGGDGTALLATDKTVEAGNSMTGALNACWDHWEASTNMEVDSNYCDTVFYGVLMTGGDTLGNEAGITRYGSITNNRIHIHGATAQSAIWLNGLLVGSGVANITISGNQITGDGIANFGCFGVTGLSTNDIIVNNSCRNSGPASGGVQIGADPGGTAENIEISNNIFDGIKVQAPGIAVIQIGGPHSVATGNKIMGGMYPSCVWLAADGDKAIDNSCEAGTGTKYNVTGARNPEVIEVGP
jgi:hypothetical protein